MPTPSADRTARRRGELRRLALALALMATVAVVAAQLTRTSAERLNEDSCVAAAGSAALLIDLRKPMPDATGGSVFREVARRVDAGVELRVFTLAADRPEPRFLGGICRSYDDGDLDVAAAKDSRAAVRDCNDLPAQIAPDLRQAATDYCAKRAALEGRIDVMARDAANGGRVADAYLMDALEETVGDLAGGAGPKTLFVLSDMLHHAPWYSHLDLDWTAWSFDDFELVRRAHDSKLPRRPAELAVRVLYQPRLGLTDAWRAREAHRTFWRRYFDGADIAFEDRAPLPGYAAATLMDLAGDARKAIRQREALANERAEAERRLRDIEDERQALAARRRAAIEATDMKGAEVAELRRTRQALGAERRRLQLELSSLPERRTQTAALPVPVPEQGGATAPAPALCGLSLVPEFRVRLEDERYLGDRRTNYGAGTIAVRYAVTAQGLTVDDAVVVQPKRSTASRTEHFDILAEDASGLVRDWRFAVECGADGAVGAEGQTGMATFRYREKCSGAPLPRCRTVLFDVAFSADDDESVAEGSD